MNKVILSGIIFALILSGCSSANQVNGVFSGGMLGGIFGSSIGGLMDGPRGHDTGNLVGMVIGGVIGGAVTAPKTNNISKYDNSDNYSQRKKSNSYYSMQDTYAQSIEREYDNINVINLRFIDNNNNHIIDAAEHAKIQFEIINNGTETLYDITPVIGVTDNKRILISPTAIIASISPGRGVKYTAEIYGKPNLKTGTANFTLGFAKKGYIYTFETFQLKTKSK